jgi:hypothetical protein
VDDHVLTTIDNRCYSRALLSSISAQLGPLKQSIELPQTPHYHNAHDM